MEDDVNGGSGTDDSSGSLGEDVIEDPGTATIYLARHGRTGLNANGQLRGLLDPPLDDVGRKEAQALAEALAPLEPELVISSPLRRAVETASAIAAACGIDAEVDARLIDRDYGPWAGHRLEDVLAEWGTLDNAPGIEPLRQVRERARLVLEEVAEQLGSERAVVVAHDAVNRPLISMLDPGRWPQLDDIPQRTGCFNVLYRGTDRWFVAQVDMSPLDTARSRDLR
ncbi:MAG: histidine phosphatase family protein [Actinomycetota bacterium]|nr:histidine phosphatase family protein [Actinomycetota bacterium]